MYQLFAFLKAVFVVLVIASKGFAGVVIINLIQVAYFAVEMYFWRQHKVNFKLFIFDEILTLVAYNTVCLVEVNTKILQALLIVALYGIFFIKTYYVVTAFLLQLNEKQEAK